MHGIIFQVLKKYVVETANVDMWNEITKKANAKTFHLTLTRYPDSELIELCKAASEKLNVPLPKLLENFGVYLMGELMQMYSKWVKPEWDALDFLCNCECVMHTVAKSMTCLPYENPQPPQLTTERISNAKISLRYNSPRKLCTLAKGLILGTGKHYQTKLGVTEIHCMHQGFPYCEFVIEKV